MHIKVELNLPSGNIHTLRVENMLDLQVMEAFADVLNKTKALDLLEHLNDISKNGIPNLQKA